MSRWFSCFCFPAKEMQKKSAPLLFVYLKTNIINFEISVEILNFQDE